MNLETPITNVHTFYPAGCAVPAHECWWEVFAHLIMHCTAAELDVAQFGAFIDQFRPPLDELLDRLISLTHAPEEFLYSPFPLMAIWLLATDYVRALQAEALDHPAEEAEHKQ